MTDATLLDEFDQRRACRGPQNRGVAAYEKNTPYWTLRIRPLSTARSMASLP